MTLVYIIMGSIIVISFITGVILTKKENKTNRELKLGDDPKLLFENQNSPVSQQMNTIQNNGVYQPDVVTQSTPSTVIESIPSQPIVQNLEQGKVSVVNTQQVVNQNLGTSSVVSTTPSSSEVAQTNIVSNSVVLPNEQPSIINSVVQNTSSTVAVQENIAIPVTPDLVEQDSEVI